MSSKTNGKVTHTEAYQHPTADVPLHPDVGTQPQYRKKFPAKSYRYDSSLSPALNWDGQNSAREQGEQLLQQIADATTEEVTTLEEARAALAKTKEAVAKLKALGHPFLDWAGKAERLSFDVPTLPLFVHERLSTQNILETLKTHKPQLDMMEMFGNPGHTITDQVLRSYEHGPRSIRDPWVNRLILGDSLVVMNSLLHLDSLGGQVQMIYMDPPYGVKFGSNFQPFVRKRDVAHGDDDNMTREPEMVQAYRDTWEVGIHSYLTYLRDRFLLARDLLTPSGSLFVQISDDNLHHVREVLDEVFGEENFVSIITFTKTGGASTTLLPPVADFLMWYAKDMSRLEFQQLYLSKEAGEEGATGYTLVEKPDGSAWRPMTTDERKKSSPLPDGWRIFDGTPLMSPGVTENGSAPFIFAGKEYTPPANSHWKTSIEGLKRLSECNRIVAIGNRIEYKRYLNDFPVHPITNVWTGMGERGFVGDKYYVVQTDTKVIQRCMQMTSKPGDLIIDPTCGSGTTAYVAEQLGRRWITIDTSRVPLALARQRLLTATYPYYELADDVRGPAGGFVYKRRQNRKGEEIGGIVPHIKLEDIANNKPSEDIILIDRAEVVKDVTRIAGPFRVEGVIPAPNDMEAQDATNTEATDAGPFAERLLEILRRSPVLRLSNNETLTFRNIRPPARTLALSAEAVVDVSAPGQTPTLQDIADEADERNGHRLPLTARPVAFVFGPENGAVSEKLVYEAAREADAKNYTHLYVIGFAIQANARALIENCSEVFNIPATYVQATPDLMMSDLLKHTRSSQIFSVCGLPEIKVHKLKDGLCQVELLGLDVFDPVTLAVQHEKSDNVPAWFLDINYNGQCFYVSQAFFPRTSAWDSLKKALKADYDAAVWDHLAGTLSAPFEPGENRAIAVKVIDDRGNELLVERRLDVTP